MILQVLTIDHVDMFDHLHIFYANSIIYKLHRDQRLFIL
jgi:hypothetical protein